jgi:outer membrane biosynthesis protein TonB
MWSMPDKILRIVAGLLAACCVAGFILGVLGAPTRGRLPGEAAAGDGGTPMAATEAQPLNSEELGPPKPPEPIAQEIDEEDEKPAPPPPPKAAAPVPAPAADPVGALLEQPAPAPAAPAQEDPPF